MSNQRTPEYRQRFIQIAKQNPQWSIEKVDVEAAREPETTYSTEPVKVLGLADCYAELLK